MRRLSVRAVILCAGLGLRLRPLTLFLPKPLLPVCGEPVAGHTLRQLALAGCEAVALNLHHLPTAIPQHFGRRWSSDQGEMALEYSVEPTIQGTLGALFPLREFLAPADVVLLLNGDTLCPWPLAALLRAHLRTQADATLLVLERSPDLALGGAVAVGAGGRIVGLRDAVWGTVRSRHVFAGAHVFSPRLLSEIAPRPTDIIADLYMPLLAAGGRLQAVKTRAPWHDLGTPGRYLAAVQAWVQQGSPAISPQAMLDPAARVAATVIEAGVVVEPGAEVEASLLLPGARIAPGVRLHGCLVGPEARLPPGTRAVGRMINRLPADYQPGPREEVWGSLVATPLET